ncbi:MAG TPA: amidohydrolase family protein [Acidimicrobiia bacterium]|nr:amidohydrolase family protein [Acidimicrobiia bacterium]
MIDVHAHVVLPGTLGAAGPYGPEIVTDAAGGPSFRTGRYTFTGVRYENSAFVDPGVRLAAMDEAGITFQVLSPNPLTYFHHIEAEVAAAFCRRHNDELARVVAAHPHRLGGLAALALQDPGAAAAELRRSVTELGLLGAAFGTSVGRSLDDPALDPLWAAAVELDVPLFLHPGLDCVDAPHPDPRLERFDLELVVGFAAEETLAVATLIYGGVLDRHPALDLCLSHGGGAVAFLFGRLRQATRVRAWASPELAAPGGFEHRLARLWFDCHVHDRRSLAFLIEMVGAERLVIGTNFAGWDQGAPPEDPALQERLTANARRLLRLDRPS